MKVWPGVIGPVPEAVLAIDTSATGAVTVTPPVIDAVLSAMFGSSVSEVIDIELTMSEPSPV